MTIGMARAGAGISRSAGGAAAGAEAVAAALDDTGGAASAVLLFATVHHADPRPVLYGARRVAGDAVIVGCSASGVLCGSTEIEDGPGVAALALVAGDSLSACAIGGKPPRAGRLPHALALVLCDGYSQHPEAVVAELEKGLGREVAVAGGLAVGAQGVYPALRWIDGEVLPSMCGLLVESAAEPIVGVAQGCSAEGPAHVVTRAEGSVVVELDGRRAFDVFAERARPLLPDPSASSGRSLRRAAQAVLLAVPGAPGGAGDRLDDGWVVRGILQFDPDRGLLAVSEPLAPGTPVRFALRDGQAARVHLRRMLDDARARLGGRRPRFGVYFACAGRGRGLFGIDDHDVSFIQGALGPFPLVGMFAGGELGPTRGAVRLQLFSGVLALVP